MRRLATKRCTRCGYVALMNARRRHCYQRRFGKGSYACWGKLEMVRTEKKRPAVAPAKEVTVKQSARDVAQKKLAYAQRKLEEKRRTMARLLKVLARWERKVRYYTQQVALTDDERAALKAERDQLAAERQRTKARRGIKLVGGSL